MSIGKHLEIKIYPSHVEREIQLPGGDITPRGVLIQCSAEQLNLLHQMDEPQQAKFESARLKIGLHFSGGDRVMINTDAQIQSIRRISQKQFEISMSFLNMAQDGYRHIARYISDASAENAY